MSEQQPPYGEPYQPPSNPYQQQPPPPPYGAYGQPGVPWGPPPDHPQSTTVLILGILGLVLCQVIAPFAWTMGNRVKAEIEAAPARYGGLQQANIGRILGIVGTALLGLYVLGFVAYVIFVVAIFGASTT